MKNESESTLISSIEAKLKINNAAYSEVVELNKIRNEGIKKAKLFTASKKGDNLKSKLKTIESNTLLNDFHQCLKRELINIFQKIILLRPMVKNDTPEEGKEDIVTVVSNVVSNVVSYLITETPTSILGLAKLALGELAATLKSQNPEKKEINPKNLIGWIDSKELRRVPDDIAEIISVRITIRYIEQIISLNDTDQISSKIAPSIANQILSYMNSHDSKIIGSEQLSSSFDRLIDTAVTYGLCIYKDIDDIDLESKYGPWKLYGFFCQPGIKFYFKEEKNFLYIENLRNNNDIKHDPIKYFRRCPTKQEIIKANTLDGKFKNSLFTLERKEGEINPLTKERDLRSSEAQQVGQIVG